MHRQHFEALTTYPLQLPESLKILSQDVGLYKTFLNALLRNYDIVHFAGRWSEWLLILSECLEKFGNDNEAIKLTQKVFVKLATFSQKYEHFSEDAIVDIIQKLCRSIDTEGKKEILDAFFPIFVVETSQTWNILKGFCKRRRVDHEALQIRRNVVTDIIFTSMLEPMSNLLMPLSDKILFLKLLRQSENILTEKWKIEHVRLIRNIAATVCEALKPNVDNFVIADSFLH